MSEHRHSQFVEGCFRCDLSRDEVSRQCEAPFCKCIGKVCADYPPIAQELGIDLDELDDD